MRRSRLLLALGFLGAALISASACSDQAEGERCDPNNGDSDCNSGLICTKFVSLNIASASGAAICCPPAGQPTTTTICQNQGNNLSTDAGSSTGGSAGDAGSSPDATPGAGGASGAGGSPGSGGAGGGIADSGAAKG